MITVLNNYPVYYNTLFKQWWDDFHNLFTCFQIHIPIYLSLYSITLLVQCLNNTRYAATPILDEHLLGEGEHLEQGAMGPHHEGEVFKTFYGYILNFEFMSQQFDSITDCVANFLWLQGCHCKFLP